MLRVPTFHGSLPLFHLSCTPCRTAGQKADEVWMLEELRGKEVFKWDGKKTIAIFDDEQRLVAVLVPTGRPMVKPGMSDDWPEVIARFEAAIDRLRWTAPCTRKIRYIAVGPTPP
ncbi:hypothetical protein FIBSPDRAFT_949273 [Athelia psychrophila]|uniref:Uncharacterized protein n=1 Tax=Athelia psychrophila TaxID=1759441 RepID=A0A166Q2S7_9AGAM|nr:hypothetical protein FIBSPDRAFT_949273 [Fibularhizoctonia sp. CBS 109695]